jgi:hypothetical protein
MTPMVVQYLVGLCCAKWDPDAVAVTVGDMVMDPAAGKERDVDVTVKVDDPEGGPYAFKAYEVKHEGTSIDVTETEQLCIKLNDMTDVTHRAIVSTSGYSDGAQLKAKSHGVELYQLVPWDRPLEEQFPALAPMKGTPQECFPSRHVLLTWNDWRLSINVPTAPSPFSLQAEDPLFDSAGKVHAIYSSFSLYTNELLLRSTQTLVNLEPAQTIARTFIVPLRLTEDATRHTPAWPHTHTLDVRGDEVYAHVSDQWCRLDTVTINGFLQFQPGPPSMYYIMRMVPDGQPFAGTLVTLGKREGEIKALIFSPNSREIDVNLVQIPENQLNMIRQLQIRGSS